MEFQVTERVAAKDPDIVLRALEPHLRAVAGIVERSDGKIAAVGIGPVPLRFNPRDLTVIQALAVEGHTVLTARVQYQPSGMSGNIPQAQIVKEKIEAILGLMRADLKLERIQPKEEPNSPAVEVAEKVEEQAADIHGETAAPESVPDVAVAEVSTEPEVAAAIPAEAATELEIAAVPSEVAASAPEATTVPEAQVTPEVVAAMPDEVEAIAATEVSAVKEPEKINKMPEKITVPYVARFSFEETREEEEKAPKRGRGWLITAGVGVVLLAGALAANYWESLPIPEGWGLGEARVQHPAAVAPQEPSKPDRTAFESAPELAVKPEKDLNLWAQDWAAALRSRDPAAQGSYYADTVAKYLGHSDVSREFVVEDKSGELQRREHLATIKIEQLEVINHTNSEAALRVVKHSIVQTPSKGVSETFVRTRLKLRKSDGVWKIVEEEDLPHG